RPRADLQVAERSEETIGLHLKLRDCIGGPRRHIDFSVGRSFDRVGIMISGKSLHDCRGREIDHGQTVGHVLGYIKIVAHSRYSEAGGIARARLIWRFLGENDLPFQCGDALAPRVTENRVVISARCEEFAAIARTTNAEEGWGWSQGLQAPRGFWGEFLPPLPPHPT